MNKGLFIRQNVFYRIVFLILVTTERLHQIPSLDKWHIGDFKPVFLFLQCLIRSKKSRVKWKNWKLLEKSTFFLEKICFQKKALSHNHFFGQKMSHRPKLVFQAFVCFKTKDPSIKVLLTFWNMTELCKVAKHVSK